MKDYVQKNQETIDRWVIDGWEWGKPLTHQQYEQALLKNIGLYLTPTIPVPADWFGEVFGKKVLGLAAGGGQQGPLLVAWGAKVTIVDFSKQQLLGEQEVALREGYTIETVQADVTERLPFSDQSFDIIVHPVANCYIRDVQPVWREAYRVLKPGGVLLSGLDNGMNFIVDEQEEKIVNRLPFDPVINSKQRQQMEKQGGGMQFSHTLTEQIGGQLSVGFELSDVYEDTNGGGRLAELNIPSFWVTRSVKPF